MDLSVVVVTHNQHDLLRQCVLSVLSALGEVDGELIVIDNASTDYTPQMMAAEFPDVCFLRNTVNLHYTRAVNQGMRATSGEFILLLNDDTEVECSCFQNLLSFMREKPRCGAVGPALLTPPSKRVQLSAQRFPTPFREIVSHCGIAARLRDQPWADGMQSRYSMPGHAMCTQQVDWVCGGAVLFRRAIMQQLGYHDEQYLFYRDDPDIGMRLRAVGWEVWYCTDGRIVHYHGMSSVKTERKVRFDLISVRSRRHYHRKFHGLLGSLAVECSDGIITLLGAIKCLILLRFSVGAERWRHLFVLFQAIAMPSEEREAIEGYRRAPYNGMESMADLNLVATEGGQ